jgi:DNA-binding transcriptional LysR family regulator
VQVSGPVEANSPQTIAAAARAGLGFAKVPHMIVQQDLVDRRLVTVLEEFEPDEIGVFIVYPHRDRMPAKLRAFIDHMAAWFEGEQTLRSSRP